MRALLADPKQDITRRQQALDVLVKGQDKETADVLLSDAVLANPDLQSAAVKALSTLGNDKTPSHPADPIQQTQQRRQSGCDQYAGFTTSMDKVAADKYRPAVPYRAAICMPTTCVRYCRSMMMN